MAEGGRRTREPRPGGLSWLTLPAGGEAALGTGEKPRAPQGAVAGGVKGAAAVTGRRLRAGGDRPARGQGPAEPPAALVPPPGLRQAASRRAGPAGSRG